MDKTKCGFTDSKCSNEMIMNDLYGTPMRLIYCQNCLIGNLIKVLQGMKNNE